MQRLKAFHHQHEDTIFKPLDGMGGSAIFRVKPGDPNISVILEMLTRNGCETIMAQKYIPQIEKGDKRILMINGEPIPYCLARVPLAGETRGNLAAGGTGQPQPLSERDQWIAAQVGPTLREKGLLFVGLDVIGDYLTEINVTSPTCIREIDAGYGLDIGGQLMDCIDRAISYKALIRLMYYLETGGDKARSISATPFFIALVVHAALILTISFKAGTPTCRTQRPQIQVTLCQSTQYPVTPERRPSDRPSPSGRQ